MGFPGGTNDKELACKFGFGTWVWEDPLEEGMATHSRILAWRNPTDRGAWQATVREVAMSQTRLSN